MGQASSGAPTVSENLGMFRLRQSSKRFCPGPRPAGWRMSQGSWGATLTAAGTLITLVRAVKEAVAALREHDAGLTVLALELQGRAGQRAMRGCNT